jgi:hypothetical protein
MIYVILNSLSLKISRILKKLYPHCTCIAINFGYTLSSTLWSEDERASIGIGVKVYLASIAAAATAEGGGEGKVYASPPS